jgi:hypothetical protein
MYPHSFIYFGVLHGLAVMLLIARLTASWGRWLWPLGALALALPWAVQPVLTGPLAGLAETLNSPAERLGPDHPQAGDAGLRAAAALAGPLVVGFGRRPRPHGSRLVANGQATDGRGRTAGRAWPAGAEATTCCTSQY